MKKLFIMLAAAAALFMFPSCEKIKGEGPLRTESRAVTNFSGVDAGVSGRINYTIDPVYKVEITAQRNILDVIETFNESGYLRIKIKNGKQIKTNEDIVINISAPSADYLHLSGSGNLSLTGTVVATNINMKVSGSGSIALSNVAVTEKIRANISGSGNIQTQGGTAKDLDLKISGSGKIILDGVAAEKAVTNISGSGDIYVKLSQLLDATISGSGSVYYRGNPQVITHISGSGKIMPL